MKTRSYSLFVTLSLAASTGLGGLACEVDDGVDGMVDAEGSGELEDSEGDDDADSEFRLWTGWTSEEYQPLVCGAGRFIRGADCYGAYCDQTSVDCHWSGAQHGESHWTSYFSEEGSGTADERHCPWGEFVTGVACSGSYCDQLSLRCTEAIGAGFGNCQWSGWHSEEHGPFQTPAGRYIKGVECSGSYCDSRRYRHCIMTGI